MDTAAPTSTKPRRRWLRFSLRTLLVAMTVLCIWLAIQVNAARRQREAVSAILSAGAKIEFDYQMLPGSEPEDIFGNWDRADVSPPGPAWLRMMIGDEYFREVVRVDIEDCAVREADFAQLANLPRLQELRLAGITIEHNDSGLQRPIHDNDLAVLQGLGELRALTILPGERQRWPDIRGPGLAKLAALTRLQMLNLDRTQLDDTGLEQIGKMTGLKSLSLDSANITDAGLEHLQNLTGLERLNLGGTGITDAGLGFLQNLRSLKFLSLDRTMITGTGLRHLNSEHLESLHLRYGRLSDEGMKHVGTMKFCRNLYLFGTRVTPEGIRELQKSLPKTRIAGP